MREIRVRTVSVTPTLIAAESGFSTAMRAPSDWMTSRVQYSPSASPCGGRARSRIVCRWFGARTTRRGKASIHRAAEGAAESGRSNVARVRWPSESVTG
jgi:hypothetical protein